MITVTGVVVNHGDLPRCGVKVKAHPAPSVGVAPSGHVASAGHEVVVDEVGGFTLPVLRIPGTVYRFFSDPSGHLPDGIVLVCDDYADGSTVAIDDLPRTIPPTGVSPTTTAALRAEWTADDEAVLAAAQEYTDTHGGGGGGGAVSSVNGQVGVVVLDAGDVGADPAGTAADLVGAEAAARAAGDAADIPGDRVVGGTLDGNDVTIAARRLTAGQWAAQGTLVPAQGEVCVAWDTWHVKVGDGITSWADLPYVGDVSYLTKTVKITGAPVVAGQTLKLVGSTGGVLLASPLAPGDDLRTYLGLAATAGAVNATVLAVREGEITKINTSAWAEGTRLYVDPATGALTPAAPLTGAAVLAAIVTRQSASTGSITVRLAPAPDFTVATDRASVTVLPQGVALPVYTDPRFTDARNPLAHAHPASDISDSTVTGRALLTAAGAAAARDAIGAGTSSFGGAYADLTGKPTLGTAAAADATAFAAASRIIAAGTGLAGGGNLTADRTLDVVYGTTAGTAAQGNDVRLSDARTPLAHTHDAAAIVSGIIPPARLGVGTADSTTVLYGDGTYKTAPTGGGGFSPVVLSVAGESPSSTVAYQTAAASTFTKIQFNGAPPTTNVGGGTWANDMFTVPVAGRYAVGGLVRITDMAWTIPVRSLGIGIHTDTADFAAFMWVPFGGSIRGSVEYLWTGTFEAGAQLRFVIYSDGQNFPIYRATMIIDRQLS